MISESKIVEIVEGEIANTNYYIVEVKVSSSNQIRVIIDGDEGVKIDDCVAINRAIEGQFDREEEDYELMVSSSGLDQPLKLLRQYQKYLGKEVKITLNSGGWLKGQLQSATEEAVTIEQQVKEKVEGKKKKQLVNKTITVPMEELKETKVIISFK